MGVTIYPACSYFNILYRIIFTCNRTHYSLPFCWCCQNYLWKLKSSFTSGSDSTSIVKSYQVRLSTGGCQNLGSSNISICSYICANFFLFLIGLKRRAISVYPLSDLTTTLTEYLEFEMKTSPSSWMMRVKGIYEFKSRGTAGLWGQSRSISTSLTTT